MRQKLKTAPRLLQRHKDAQLQFAQQNMDQSWEKLIYEKKFSLVGPDGFNSYWRDLRKEPGYFSKRNHGGASVMVWSGFCSDKVLRIAFPSTRMNSREYIEVLNDCLKPCFDNNDPNEWQFQLYKARIHVSRETLRWLDDQEIRVIQGPVCFLPDLKPIENIWGILVSRKSSK